MKICLSNILTRGIPEPLRVIGFVLERTCNAYHPLDRFVASTPGSCLRPRPRATVIMRCDSII